MLKIKDVVLKDVPIGVIPEIRLGDGKVLPRSVIRRDVAVYTGEVAKLRESPGGGWQDPTGREVAILSGAREMGQINAQTLKRTDENGLFTFDNLGSSIAVRVIYPDSLPAKDLERTKEGEIKIGNPYIR